MGKAAECWLGEQELKDRVQVIVVAACDHNIIVSLLTGLCSTVKQRQSLLLIRGLCVRTITKFIGLLSEVLAETLCNANICFYLLGLWQHYKL